MFFDGKPSRGMALVAAADLSLRMDTPPVRKHRHKLGNLEYLHRLNV